MSYLKNNLKKVVFDLDEAIVFLNRISFTEIDHDKELVKQAQKHIESLIVLHETITAVEEEVV